MNIFFSKPIWRHNLSNKVKRGHKRIKDLVFLFCGLIEISNNIDLMPSPSLHQYTYGIKYMFSYFEIDKFIQVNNRILCRRNTILKAPRKQMAVDNRLNELISLEAIVNMVFSKNSNHWAYKKTSLVKYKKQKAIFLEIYKLSNLSLYHGKKKLIEKD